MFSSPREKKLWIFTLMVVTVIYSTLGLASSIAFPLRHYGLDVTFFLMGAFLIMVMVVTQGLSIKPKNIELGVTFGVFATYILLALRLAAATERSHLMEYGVVAILMLEALRERKKNGFTVRQPGWLAFLITVLIGALDELLQLFIPIRVFDPIDILFNSLAAGMSVGVSSLLTHIRNRRVR